MNIIIFQTLEEGCRPTIDMNNFQIPEDFDLERVVEEVTKVCFIVKLEISLPE